MKLRVPSPPLAWPISILLALAATVPPPTPAYADNDRLNVSVAKMIYIVQHQAGCTNNVQVNPQLQLAAQWHSTDVRNNRALNGDLGSDGSTPQDRASAAGYTGGVQETVAINPALSITSLEVINQWHSNAEQLAVMRNCENTDVGVWTENSLDRTVVVAMYGNPS